MPNGASFDLVASPPPVYLHHSSDLGEFWLSSDSVIHTYTRWESMRPIIEQFPRRTTRISALSCTPSARCMVWPANRVDGKLTINGVGGFNRSISERFDLTVECVRRYYLGASSPLGLTFGRYQRVLRAVLVHFHGFVEFFLLHDIVTDDCSRVKFFMPFDDFKPPAVPRDVATDWRTDAARSTLSRPGTCASPDSTRNADFKASGRNARRRQRPSRALKNAAQRTGPLPPVAGCCASSARGRPRM